MREHNQQQHPAQRPGLYQEITDKIIGQIEAGILPWVQPWAGGPAFSMPVNATTRRILGALIEEAEEHGIQSVCLFTRIPDFFFKYGFRTVEDKSELPDKIFKDCQNCPRLHRCDEVAMVRGRIPRISILGPKLEAQQLVRLSG